MFDVYEDIFAQEVEVLEAGQVLRFYGGETVDLVLDQFTVVRGLFVSSDDRSITLSKARFVSGERGRIRERLVTFDLNDVFQIDVRS